MQILISSARPPGACSFNSNQLSSARRGNRLQTRLLLVLSIIVGLFLAASSASAQSVESFTGTRTSIAGGVGNSLTVTVVGSNNSPSNYIVSSPSANIRIDGAASSTKNLQGTASFVVTAPNDVAVNTPVILSARIDSSAIVTLTITVRPFISSVSLSPANVTAGQNVSGVVTFFEAPAVAQNITLASNNAAATIAGGNTKAISIGAATANFTVNTTSPASNMDELITIAASHTATGISSASNTFTINHVNITSAVSSRGNPSTIAGGIGSSFTVTVTPSTLVVSSSITLASNNALVKVDGGSTNTKVGASAQVFTITAPTAVAADAAAVLTATLNADTKTIDVTVKPFITELAIGKVGAFGGTSLTGTVTVSELPGSPVNITTASNNGNATTTGTATVLTNGTCTFTINTTTVASISDVQISASLGANAKTASFELGPLPAITSMTFGSDPILAGTATSLTVNLSTRVVSEDFELTLTSGVEAMVASPGVIAISRDATSFTVPIQSFDQPTGLRRKPKITATYADLSVAGVAEITLVEVAPESLVLTPSTFAIGSAGQATLNLYWPTDGATTFNVVSNKPHLIPSFDLIVDGTTGTVSFPSILKVLNGPVAVNLTVTFNGVRQLAVVVLTPVAHVQSLVLTPSSVNEGETGSLTVTLTQPAAGETTVSIVSSNPAKVPGFDVVFQDGETEATVAVPTNFSAAGATARVTLSGTLNGETKSAILELTPVVKDVAVSSTTVSSEGTVEVTVNLTKALGADASFTLSGNAYTNIGGAVINIPAGSTSGTFTLNAKRVTRTLATVITVVGEGYTKSKKVTIEPAG